MSPPSYRRTHRVSPSSVSASIHIVIIQVYHHLLMRTFSHLLSRLGTLLLVVILNYKVIIYAEYARIGSAHLQFFILNQTCHIWLAAAGWTAQDYANALGTWHTTGRQENLINGYSITILICRHAHLQTMCITWFGYLFICSCRGGEQCGRRITKYATLWIGGKRYALLLLLLMLWLLLLRLFDEFRRRWWRFRTCNLRQITCQERRRRRCWLVRNMITIRIKETYSSPSDISSRSSGLSTLPVASAAQV